MQQPPPVQYATTDDGVHIAYAVAGEGPSVVVLSEPSASHVELEWSQPVLAGIFGRLAEHVRLVRIDVRGTGLSDRVQAPGPAAVISDVEAVVAKLGLSGFVLGGVQALSPAAVVYAASHPDEVSKLVLIDPTLRVLDIMLSPQITAIVTAAQADWTIATEAIGLHVFGPGRPETRAFGAYVRECIDPWFYRMALQATPILDATAAAPNVAAPTLVVRHAEHPYISAEVARGVTAAIPDARLITMPGLWADDPIGMADRILDWLTGA